MIAQLVGLFENYNNARELVAALQEYFSQIDGNSSDPRQWKTAIVSKGADEFYVRFYDRSLKRETFIRQPEGRWAVGIDNGESNEEVIKMAGRLLGAALWWGDLTSIYKAQAWRGEG